MSDPGRLADFLDFSSEVTAFTVFELRGTGQAEVYLATVDDVVGAEITDELLRLYAGVKARAGDTDEMEFLLRRDIFSHERVGPIARNIIKLWYVGTWYELPHYWSETYGVRERNATFGVSAASYTEGLLWPAIDANPPGAKGPGYASWSGPPRLPDEGVAS